MAAQDFESLLATIQKLNAEIDVLNKKIANTRTQLSTLKDPIEREKVGRSLGGLVTSASRKQERSSSARSIVEGELTTRTSELEAHERAVRTLEATEIKAGNSVAVQLQKEIELRRQAAREVERLNRLVREANLPKGMNYISGGVMPDPNAPDTSHIPSRTPEGNVPAGVRVPVTDDKGKILGYTTVNQGEAFSQSAYSMPSSRFVQAPKPGEDSSGQLSFRDTPFGRQGQKRVPTWAEWESKASTKQRETKAQELQRLEQERINGLKDIIRADKRYANAIRVAEKQGFSLDDLKDIRTRGTGGINQLQFQKYDDLGIRRNLDIFSSQSGRATPGISNQFRTFGQGVVRDIGELTKWSIALAAIYGPMQKLGELTQEMITNQTKLAEATISVNSSFISQGKVFNIAAESAEAAGEAITGVIDAFTLAYRASGGGADQVERLATAQKLLSDSLILSKLSTLDQATAIDTLSAALRQSGDALGGSNNALQNGTTLLDKWVRVTKVANVDLTTLATGFAVLGDAADAAGIGVDELNGLIAAIAETGIASGREVANTARAIVSGFQSDQAREEMENLGIAVEDTTGQMRPFLEIMQEISNLRQQGIIDDTQFSRLTLALGGGTRRQAAYATFIENFGRVYDVANESARANGDAQAALAKQLETVQTSLTGLANAFTTLAQTLGTEGGFLSIIQGSVEGLTSMVSIFDKLISLLGRVTPAMAAFIAATAAIKYKGHPSVQGYLGGFAERYEPIGPGGQPYIPGMEPAPTGRQRMSDFAARNLFGTNLRSSGFQGLALAALPALANFQNEDDRFGKVKAGANIVGGVGGAIVGTLVAGSPLIGAAVGTAISEAFVNSTIARKTDIFGYAQGPSVGEQLRVGGTQADIDAALEKAEIELYKSIGSGSEMLGRFISGTPRTDEVMINRLNEAIKDGNRELFEKRLGTSQGELERLGITPELARQAFSQGQEITVAPENRAYRMASEEARKNFDAALATYRGTQQGTTNVETPFSRLVATNKSAYGQDLDLLIERSKKELSTERLAGDIKGSDYARRTDALAGFDTKALQYYTALGDEFIKINDNVDNATDAFEAFNDIILSGTGDTVPEITQIVGEIEKLINLLNDPAITEANLAAAGYASAQDARDRLAQLQTTGANLLSDVYGQSQLSGLDIPQIQGLDKPVTSEENVLIEQRTKQLMDEFYAGFLGLNDVMYDALKESFDDFAVTIKDSGDEFYKRVTETDQQFRQAAVQQLEEEGKLRSQMADSFNIQQLDITSQQGAGLQGSIDYFSKYLAANFPQYQQNPEDVGVIFSDYVTDVLHGDNLAIKLALEKILDVNQKQLDGMYNIPEGATFWVPLTAAYYRPKDEGAGGMPMVDAKAVDGNTSATELNTTALMNLTDKWNNADPFLYKRPSEPHEDRYEKMNQAVEATVDKQAVDRIQSYRGRGFDPYKHEDRYDKMQTQEPVSFIENLLNGLRNFFGGMGDMYKNNGRLNPASAAGSITNNNASATQQQPVQARLDLRFENSVQLLVDGRVLASVVSPYLASDLLRLEASQGGVTKRYVI